MQMSLQQACIYCAFQGDNAVSSCGPAPSAAVQFANLFTLTVQAKQFFEKHMTGMRSQLDSARDTMQQTRIECNDLQEEMSKAISAHSAAVTVCYLTIGTQFPINQSLEPPLGVYSLAAALAVWSWLLLSSAHL